MRFFKILISKYLDPLIGIKEKRITFVTKKNFPLSGNLRIMLDEFIKLNAYELAFFRENKLNYFTKNYLIKNNVKVMSKFSIKNLLFILSSEIIVTSHSPRDAFVALKKKKRRVISLWHGVPIKRIENFIKNNITDRKKKLIIKNSKIIDAIIASNRFDQKVISKSFKISKEKVFPIGLPRFNYLNKYYILPNDLYYQKKKIKKILNDKFLILYTPTFREHNVYKKFFITNDDLNKIRFFCKKNNSVFGVRFHPYQNNFYKNLFFDDLIINLNSDIYTEPSILLKYSKILICDYSSIWIDYLILKKPIISFAPDLNIYIQNDRNFNYNYKGIFPGQITNTWEQVIHELTKSFKNNFKINDEKKYSDAKKIFLPKKNNLQNDVKECARIIYN